MSAQGEAAPRPTRLGRYELITRIGQGGMAEVQLALQRGPAGFEKLVVVKLVHESLASQKAFVDMLLDEARVAALVKHPNVVDIYDLGEAEGRYFIAMEYLEGEPLLAVLRAGREGKRLDPLSTGRLIADTAEGLDAAHELRSMAGDRVELVHHDISLGNIVVLYNGQVKLVDFGVAKATQSASSKTKVQGKFSYMAPEKLKGAPGDRRSDIFSLGCVMWEALTLKRLFRGATDSETMKQVLGLSVQPPSKVNGDVPPEYDAIVMRALDRDPTRRQLTAKEMAVEIEELLRQRGYGAKNDRVARYMQDTFKGHIDARKKLVQEVVQKGVASAEVLDAAFSEPVLAQIATPVNGADFSVKYRRVTPVPGTLPPMPGTLPPVPNAFADASKPTEIDRPAFDGATEIGPPPIHEPEDDAEIELTHIPEMGWRALLGDPRQRLVAASITGGALVLIMLVAIAMRGGGAKAAAGSDTAHFLQDDPPHVGSAPVAIAGADSGGATVAPNAVVPDPTPATTAAPPPLPAPHPPTEHPIEHPHPHPAAPAPPPVDAEALYRQGVQAFVKGQSRDALAVLLKARAAKPGYAPTWRVLGQVYEKLGEKAAAKTAFTRYLQLAPSASDAPQIHQRLDQL